MGFVGPVLLAVVSTCALSSLPRCERLKWGASLSSIATLTLFLTMLVFGAGGMSLLTLVWLPWFLLFSLPLAFIEWRKHSWRRSTLAALGLLPLLYLGSALLTFDFLHPELCYDQETPDRQNRPPAIGPQITWTGRLLCKPEGPCFLFSCDYTGQEWIWSLYQPVLRIWFALPNCPAYDGLHRLVNDHGSRVVKSP